MESRAFADEIVHQTVQITPKLQATVTASVFPSGGMCISWSCEPFERRTVYVLGSPGHPEFRGAHQESLSQEAVIEMLAAIFGGPPGPYPGKTTRWLERVLARGWAVQGRQLGLREEAGKVKRSKKKAHAYGPAVGAWVQAALTELGIDPQDLEIPVE